MATFGLVGTKQSNVHLQDDLRRGFVDGDETADIDVGPMFRGHVVAFQMVPGKFNPGGGGGERRERRSGKEEWKGGVKRRSEKEEWKGGVKKSEKRSNIK